MGRRATATPGSRPALGKPAELSNTARLDTDELLRLEGLHGRVVLLEVPTFGCLNFQRTRPSLQSWHEAYGDQGLVVIGNPTLEVACEEGLENLRQAIERLGTTCPIAQDMQPQTWSALGGAPLAGPVPDRQGAPAGRGPHQGGGCTPPPKRPSGLDWQTPPPGLHPPAGWPGSAPGPALRVLDGSLLGVVN
ncbi:MAG: hypothetical protein MUO23_10700 [Anaerolineales bacterium]|nr:hypothetical protein [Anaerolineales bacterium]